MIFQNGWKSKKQIVKEVNALIEEKKEKPVKKVENKPKKIIFKYKELLDTLKQKFQKAWTSQAVEELKPIFSYVIGYGALGFLSYYAIKYAVTGNGYWFVALIGFGTLLYLITDMFSFFWEHIRIIWERRK